MDRLLMVRAWWTAVVSLTVATPALAQQPPVPLTSDDVETFADAHFARYVREYAQPSLAVVVVRGDSILLMKGYGTEDGQRPVDPSSTVFNVASLSKLMVASAAMQLVEKGSVALDDDIAPLLGGVRIRGDAPPVTLRHLLTHTSGLEGPFLRDVVADPGQLVALRQYFTEHPPRRGAAPGEECRYSNYAMALAGYLVELVSGEPFQEYAERHIFAPLGMTRSSFRQPPPEALAARIATAGAGRVPDVLLPYPAGAMVSSPADMARFMMAHVNGGRVGPRSILSEASVRTMQTRQWSADARAPGIALGFFESTLGGEPGLFHTGARIHYSLLYLFPAQKVGVFLVHSMRQGGAFQTLRTDFVRAFAARYFPHEPERVLGGGGAAARAEHVAGVYRPHILPTTTIERAVGLFSDTRVRARPDGMLELRVPGGPTLTLVEIDSELYRASAGPEEGLTIAFARDPLGRVRRMSMSGNTQDPIIFDRLAWYQRGRLHAGLLAIILLLFVGCTVAEAAGRLVRFVRRRTRVFGTTSARLTWSAATIPGLFFLASPVSIAVLALAHTGEDAAADALRLALIVGCTFLLAGVVVALALVPLSVRVWRAGYWSKPRRLYFYVLASGVLIAAPLLLHYRLLGYWF